MVVSNGESEVRDQVMLSSRLCPLSFWYNGCSDKDLAKNNTEQKFRDAILISSGVLLSTFLIYNNYLQLPITKQNHLH